MQSLGAALVVSSSRSADAARTSALAPDLVVIVIDDMRWDVMGCAGHPVVRTPNLDRIAARGVRFENAFVTTSLCFFESCCDDILVQFLCFFSPKEKQRRVKETKESTH